MHTQTYWDKDSDFFCLFYFLFLTENGMEVKMGVGKSELKTVILRDNIMYIKMMMNKITSSLYKLLVEKKWVLLVLNQPIKNQ